MTVRLRRMASLSVVGALVMISAVAGCTSSKAAPKAGTCLTSIAAAAATATPSADVPAAVSGPGSGRMLPRVRLGCLDGSGDVTVAAIGRPMIVTFWATYCAPCQDELPVEQEFASAAGRRVAVVGVDTADVASKGRSMVSDFGLTFPMVSDPDTVLLSRSVGGHAVPTLLFVTTDGHIAYSISTNHLDATALRGLSAKYLGVRVADA